jgi:hypothetical protein
MKGDVVEHHLAARGKTRGVFLAVNRVPYDLMPLGRRWKRCSRGKRKRRSSCMMMTCHAGSQADLIAWDINTRKVGYGVYTVADARQVRKPAFVFASASAPAVHPLQVNLSDSQAAGSQLSMI